MGGGEGNGCEVVVIWLCIDSDSEWQAGSLVVAALRTQPIQKSHATDLGVVIEGNICVRLEIVAVNCGQTVARR